MSEEVKFDIETNINPKKAPEYDFITDKNPEKAI